VAICQGREAGGRHWRLLDCRVGVLATTFGAGGLPWNTPFRGFRGGRAGWFGRLRDVSVAHDPRGRLRLLVERAVSTLSSLGVVGHDHADYQSVAIAEARKDPQPTITGGLPSTAPFRRAAFRHRPTVAKAPRSTTAAPCRPLNDEPRKLDELLSILIRSSSRSACIRDCR
jgi:hypothetical protein